MSKLRLLEIEKIAEDILKGMDIDTLPVNPFEIAEKKEILLKPMPDMSAGVSGMLIRVGEEFAIGYPTHIDNDGFINFSVSHELGHYFLPEHPENVFDSNGQHFSKAGFNSSDRYEREADFFAACFLMPGFLFKQEMRNLNDDLEAVEKLSTLCNTSLESTAIRYVQKASAPMAVIRSCGSVIDYCFMSKDMEDFEDFKWPRKGSYLSSQTATASFNENEENIRKAKRFETEANLQDWFSGDRQVSGKEEVVGLGSYGKTLTIISTDTFADDLEDEDSDEYLEERWTPKFR